MEVSNDKVRVVIRRNPTWWKSALIGAAVLPICFLLIPVVMVMLAGFGIIYPIAGIFGFADLDKKEEKPCD